MTPVSPQPPRLLVLGWSHDERELSFMKKSRALLSIAPVIVSSSLAAVLRTALKRPLVVVVLRPETADEHAHVEKFLLEIDSRNKVDSHYAIVISEKGRSFKSGVQSHSVINACNEDAVLRAVRQGVGAIEARSRVERATPAAEFGSNGLPQQSLLEYFKLPAFKPPVSVVSDLSRDGRESLVIALGELQHAVLDVPSGADSIERAAAWARKFWDCEVAIISRVELVQFNPVRAEPVKPAHVPPPGSGALSVRHPLAAKLGITTKMSLDYCWIGELDCCLISWGATREKSLLSQALLYTILRMRRIERFKAGDAA